MLEPREEAVSGAGARAADADEPDLATALCRAHEGKKPRAVLTDARIPIDARTQIYFEESEALVWRRITTQLRREHLARVVEIVLTSAATRAYHDMIRRAWDRWRAHRKTEIGWSDGEHLQCDRVEAWDAIVQAAIVPGGHAILLCGKPGDGHHHFVERIGRFAPSQTGAIVHRLSAFIHEHDADDARLALVDALGVDHGSVAAEIAGILDNRALMVIYPSVRTAEHARWLSEHDAQGLPRLLADVAAARGGAPAPHGFVAIQPIHWQPGFWDWIRPLSGHARAHRRMRGLLAGKRIPGLWIRKEELGAITPKHVEDFIAHRFAGDPERRSAALGIAAGLVGGSAEETLNRLEELLSNG